MTVSVLQYDCVWQGQSVIRAVCDKGSVWQVSVITLILIDAAAWAGETGGYFPRPAPWEPSLPTHDTGPPCAIKMQH